MYSESFSRNACLRIAFAASTEAVPAVGIGALQLILAKALRFHLSLAFRFGLVARIWACLRMMVDCAANRRSPILALAGVSVSIPQAPARIPALKRGSCLKVASMLPESCLMLLYVAWSCLDRLLDIGKEGHPFPGP